MFSLRNVHHRFCLIPKRCTVRCSDETFERFQVVGVVSRCGVHLVTWLTNQIFDFTTWGAVVGLHLDCRRWTRNRCSPATVLLHSPLTPSTAPLDWKFVRRAPALASTVAVIPNEGDARNGVVFDGSVIDYRCVDEAADVVISCGEMVYTPFSITDTLRGSPNTLHCKQMDALPPS